MGQCNCFQRVLTLKWEKSSRNTKDKSSIKVLEFLLHKPADWSDRIPEAWGSRFCIFKPESQMIPEQVTLKSIFWETLVFRILWSRRFKGTKNFRLGVLVHNQLYLILSSNQARKCPRIQAVQLHSYYTVTPRSQRVLCNHCPSSKMKRSEVLSQTSVTK